MGKYERCLWIINALNDFGDASLNELNERWGNCSLNYEKEEISTRTFARDKDAIASNFQIDIEYDARIKKYKLINAEEIQTNSIYKYLLSSFHLSSLSSLALKHKDKMMIQEVSTGVEQLHIVLDAIDKQNTLCFNYTSYYNKDKIYKYEVIPCFIRLFEHRWYLVCEYLDHSEIRVLAVERMYDLRVGEKHLTPSPNITPETFYNDCFGIIRDDKQPEEIVVKVYKQQVDYVRSVPLHHSQEEVETAEDYAIFHYYLRPSFDFVQHILWHKENIEVLSPAPFKEEICSLLKKMLERYC